MTRAILLVLSWAIAAGAGWQFRDWKAGEQVAGLRESYAEAARIAASKAQAAAEALRTTTDLAEQQAARLEALQAQKSKQVTREVIRYVQSPGADSCGVDAAGVRLINSAAAGGLPEAPDAASGPDDSTGGAAAGRIVASVVDNYLTANECRARLLALQSWLRSATGSE